MKYHAGVGGQGVDVNVVICHNVTVVSPLLYCVNIIVGRLLMSS